MTSPIAWLQQPYLRVVNRLPLPSVYLVAVPRHALIGHHDEVNLKQGQQDVSLHALIGRYQLGPSHRPPKGAARITGLGLEAGSHQPAVG